MYLRYGMGRIEVKPSPSFITFRKFGSTSGIEPKIYKSMAQIGIERGSNPDDWYASYIPILSRYFLSVEMNIKGKWVPCKDWKEIDQFVKKGMETNNLKLKMKKSKFNTSTSQSLGTFHEYVRTLSSSVRRSSILRISGNPKRDIGETQILTELVLVESESILKTKGKKFVVTQGKSDKRKFRIGNCYSNSVEMMEKGYGYVEGYVIMKQDGFTFGHSWNVDSMGNHIDFTFKDPENYDYFGVIVPENVVLDLGEKNGHSWYSVLPFVDDEFNYKVD